MIAVGVGVAPMIQTIRALLRDSAGIQVVLLYGVVSIQGVFIPLSRLILFLRELFGTF